VKVHDAVPVRICSVESAGQRRVAYVDVEPRSRCRPAREEVPRSEQRVIEQAGSAGHSRSLPYDRVEALRDRADRRSISPDQAQSCWRAGHHDRRVEDVEVIRGAVTTSGTSAASAQATHHFCVDPATGRTEVRLLSQIRNDQLAAGRLAS
jgi:hypothetical protein